MGLRYKLGFEGGFIFLGLMGYIFGNDLQLLDVQSVRRPRHFQNSIETCRVVTAFSDKTMHRPTALASVPLSKQPDTELVSGDADRNVICLISF